MFCAAGRCACEPEPCDEMMHLRIDRYSEMHVKWISMFVCVCSICSEGSLRSLPPAPAEPARCWRWDSSAAWA